MAVVVLQAFVDLLDRDSRVCEAAACCLYRLTVALQVRVNYYSDPGIVNLKQVMSWGSSYKPLFSEMYLQDVQLSAYKEGLSSVELVILVFMVADF